MHPHIRTRYNYDIRAAGQACALICEDPSLAQQHAKEDADINTLVRRFGITGTMPQLDRIPLQGDFHDITDFHTAANKILEAEQTFMTLPAELRKRFENDPHKFLDFTSDEANREEMGKLGLLKPKAPEPTPMEVIIKNPPAPTAPAPSGGT